MADKYLTIGKMPGSKTLRVVADPNSGKDELARRSEAGDVEKAFETAAQMSIVKPQQ